MRPIPKDYLLKKHDIVYIIATVKYDQLDQDDKVHFDIDGHYGSVITNPASVKGLHSHYFEVGNQVLLCDETGQPFGGTYTIIAIHEELAWISRPNGNAVVDTSALLPYTPPPPATEPPEGTEDHED